MTIENSRLEAENAAAAVPPVPPGVSEGGASSEACGAAEEERALAPLDALPQSRRVTGSHFVGRARAPYDYASFAELWGVQEVEEAPPAASDAP